MMEHNQSIQMYMTIRAQRDAAMQERNMALEERKRAFAERDMAMLQRDAAIAECNSAIQERDDAIAALRLQENSMNDIKVSLDSPGNESVHGSKHIYDQQQLGHVPHLPETVYSPWEIPKSEAFQLTEIASETTKPRKERQPKQSKTTKSSKSPGVGKRGAEDLNKQVTPKLNGLKTEQDLGSDEEDLDRQLVVWKDNSGLNQITFDESAMPVPVCSCTGLPQPCYRWGNGGWQSACCTTTMSMYPLPQVSDKRYSRVGGRKMSGSAFTKLLNRLAAEGHDLFTPLDLKDHWAKHGTNRYSTLK